jgi:TatD DNase family protein
MGIIQPHSKVFAGYPQIKVALGLHPEVAKAAEKDLLVSLVDQAVFIGVIGLDGSPRFKASLLLKRQIPDDVLAVCGRIGASIHAALSIRSLMPCSY